jgi:TRAP-type C4-dicarboxylate transport system substrate-binding protein
MNSLTESYTIKGGKVMKTSKFMLIVLLIAVPLIMSFSTLSQAAAARSLSVSIWGGSEHWMTKTVADWAKELEAATQGKVKIVLYPGGTLTSGAQAYGGVVKGISDIAAAADGWAKGAFPLTRVVDLPLGIKSPLQGSLATWGFYKKFRPKEWNEIKVLWMFNNGGQTINTTKPVRKLEDFKGLRIRSTGNDAVSVRMLGATPVAMDMGEAYIAHQKGIVNGILCSMSAMSSFKLAEVTKYHLDYPLTGCGFWVGMNKDTWNSLSPDIQKIIDGLSEKYMEVTSMYLEAENKQGVDLAKSLGNEFVTLTPNEEEKFRTALNPMLKAYVEEMEKGGLPGREALDYTISLIKKYAGRK